MPPQPGLFAVPHGATPTHTPSGITTTSIGPGVAGPGYTQHHHQQRERDHQYIGHGTGAVSSATAGSSSRHAVSTTDDGTKKKKKEPSKPMKEMASERRDDGRYYTENIAVLHNAAHVLSTRPDLSPLYNMRLYALSLERSALIASLDAEERYAIECAQVAYEEEREKVEEEWRKGRERVRERLLEGIEERRRRAREEKEGEGIIGDASLDSHSRPPITRKLRNKLGTSPPPTPHSGAHINGVGSSSAFSNGLPSGINNSLSSTLPITTGPFLNPHSLLVDDLPSPFPLPLTSVNGPSGAAGAASALGGVISAAAMAPGGGRKRVKGGGAHQGQAVGGLGKSILVLNVVKDSDLDSDLIEIRRGNKRRRAAAAATGTRLS